MNANAYTLNSVAYDKKALLNFCIQRRQVASEWECEHLNFILDWFDERDSIEAKTSGSTGIPKSILLSKAHMAASAKLTAAYFKLDKGSRVLLCLPSGYIAGKMVIVRALVNEWALDWVKPSSQPLEESVNHYDFTSMTPMQAWHAVTETPAKFSKIGKVLVGGGAIAPPLDALLRDRSNDVFETYGMTETISHVAVRRIATGSDHFTALPGIIFTTDERNCLVVSASHLGVSRLVTNDIVELLDSRNFKWIGRFDNVINTGGVKVFPERIEHAIADIIGGEYYIWKSPDEVLGEKVVLYLEGVQGSDVAMTDLMATLRNKLTTFEMPGEICFVNEFERTISGKVIRKNY